jgi:hypothetical protein
MIKTFKEKKIFYRLVAFSLITTPLFAILGGTPFFRFDFKELRDFLSGILFTATITLSFWIINIALLLLAEKYAFARNIFLRAAMSIGLGLLIAVAGFNFYTPENLPKPIRFGMEKPAFGEPGEPQILKNTGIYRTPADSVFRIIDSGGIRMSKPRFFFFPMALRSLTINLIILTLCELVFLYFRKQKIENENVYLRQMNLEAKNNQLRMQLHPHFLFNSLNTLRLLLKKDADKAEDYLLKLSDMLRFSTTAALQNVVTIEDELKLCMAYLQMQQVRFGNMLHVVVSNENLYQAKGKLPVYSLQLLAENAIKHNAFTNEEPLTIFIDYDASGNTITVRNRIQPKRTAEPTTMSGLSNLEKRYKLLTGSGIKIATTDKEFTVRINILAG